jgi:putative redox protein
VITIGAPADPGHVAHNFGGKLAEIHEKGHAMVNLAGREIEIRKQFLEDISEASLADALPQLGAALLVLHAPRDAVVSIENASTIFMAAKHPKSFVSLDNADHLLSSETDAEYVADLIATWSSRYLDLTPEPVTADAPEGVVRVAEAEAGGFRQDVTIGGKHQLVVDEPISIGGTDQGPSPYQLLSAALGACTTMTIRMYARRKGIKLSNVACNVTHNKSHPEDCEGCDQSATKVDVFHRHIRLEGDLTTEERASLLAIADKCPVHRTLHSQAQIVTDLKGA